MEKDEYINALTTKLADLSKKISQKKIEVQESFTNISQMQTQADHVVELLKAEGVKIEQSGIQNISQESVADLTYKYLSSNSSKTPMHYRQLADSIMAEGTPISGKDPAANLLSHISRDTRFVRVRAGTYGLSEWGLFENQRKSKKNKRVRR